MTAEIVYVDGSKTTRCVSNNKEAFEYFLEMISAYHKRKIESQPYDVFLYPTPPYFEATIHIASLRILDETVV